MKLEFRKPAAAGDLFCPGCGTAVQPDAVICVQCGRRLKADAAGARKRGRRIAAAALVLGIAALLVAGVAAGWRRWRDVQAADEWRMVRSRLAVLVIPEIDLRDAAPEAVAAFLSEAHRRLAPGAGALSFRVAPGRGKQAETPGAALTLQAKDMPFDQALDIVAEATGCRWCVKGGTLVLTPDGPGLAGSGRFWGWIGATNLWWAAASESTNAHAQACLGCCYLEGRGVAADRAKAMELLASSAEAGDAAAQYYLGRCLREYPGETNSMTALYWLEESAKGGNIEVEPTLTAMKKELAEEAFAYFSTPRADWSDGSNTDLLLIAKALTRMKDRTVFPNARECEGLLDACQRLIEAEPSDDLLRALTGSRLLFEYEQAMLARGYQRRWGVFMDAPSIARAEADSRQRMAEIAAWQKKQEEEEAANETRYEWKRVVKRVPAPLQGPRSSRGGAAGFNRWEMRTVYVRVPVKRPKTAAPAPAKPPAPVAAPTVPSATGTSAAVTVEARPPAPAAGDRWMRSAFGGEVRGSR